VLARRNADSCVLSEKSLPRRVSLRHAIILAAFFPFLLSAPRLALAQNKVIFLTSGTSWTVPNDWNNANNTVEVIGAGGAHKSSSATAGAGGGSYSKANSLALTPGSSVPYNIGISGLASPGESTWFGSTTRSSALVAATGGCNANSNIACANSTSANKGSVIHAGGNGGSDNNLAGFAAGGGGAAGPHGVGGGGHDSGTTSGGKGGTGDDGYGGAGGAGSNGPTSPGGAGAEYTATAGGTAGSGGGGGAGSNRNGGGSTGGAYGGGAGGGNTSGTVSGGNGLIVITYTPHPEIFVANSSYATLSSPPVTVYPFGSNGNIGPFGESISSVTGLSLPFGIAVDSNGNLYVANNNTNSVTVYRNPASASGNAAPTATIAGANTGLINPSGVALDANGNIYVANLGSLTLAPDTVTVFAAGSNGNVAPIATITGPATGLNYPTAIALDSSGKLYVANSGTQNGGADTVTVYPAGSNGNAQPSATISGAGTGLVTPWGVALDSSGNIYVANDGSSVGQLDSVTVYPAGSNGNVQPSATISGANTGLNSPGGIAVDLSGYIYVTNDGALTSNPDNITVYSPGSNGNISPFYTLNGLGLGYPIGIAVDIGDDVYVANDASNEGSVDAITTYSPGNPVPFGIIGLNPALDVPAGIAVDPSGNTYVTNQGSLSGSEDSVNIYPPGSYANVPPSAAIAANISGDNTGLALPSAITLNPAGNIFVANSAGGPDTLGSVTVYPAGSSQNQTPSATISGNSTSDNTGLNSPNGIALDPIGNIYVANTYGGPDGAGSITIYPPASNGNVTPLATISDNPNCAPCDNTNLNLPYGVALDSAGKIYVVNSAGGADGLGSITIYPALGSSSGTLNEAPSTKIAGTSTSDVTGLNVPSGVALDLAGNIYVTNEGTLNGATDSITVYSAGSSGNVAPRSTITGSNTELAVPQGIAIGSNGGSIAGVRRAPKHKKRKDKRGAVDRDRMVSLMKPHRRASNKAVAI
jgi:hypothetical protein